MANRPLNPVAVAERRKIVEKLYLEGVPTDKIVEACRREFSTARKRNIEADIHLIRKQWKEQAREMFADDLAPWWIQIALSDRRAALRAGDIRLAYNIAKDIAKMAGVNLLDIVIGHREETEKAATWAELMNKERERKQLSPEDFEVVEAVPVDGEKPKAKKKRAPYSRTPRRALASGKKKAGKK